jgi:CrcB protein
MQTLLLVMAGGAIGAAARFGVYSLMVSYGLQGFWATLSVNLVGSFLLGLVTGALPVSNVQVDQASAERLRLFVAVGVLGGFTTFSTFSLDVVQLLERRSYFVAAGYATASVVLSVLGLALGLVVARHLRSHA